MIKSLHYLAFSILLAGMFLHAYCQLKAGQYFTIYLLISLPVICFHYAAPAIASLRVRTSIPLAILIAAQITFLALDFGLANLWSASAPVADMAKTMLWIVMCCVSIIISLTVVAYECIREEKRKSIA